MAKEIERKYLIEKESWRKLALPGEVFRQGYLSTDKERTVRVRSVGDRGYLTIKGKTTGVTRSEFEYTIPPRDANELLDTLCLRPLIEKTRYRVPYAGMTWEIDEFAGENQGLILAEVELEHEGQAIELPDWIGREVSDDPRYYNANLVNHPFSRW